MIAASACTKPLQKELYNVPKNNFTKAHFCNFFNYCKMCFKIKWNAIARAVLHVTALEHVQLRPSTQFVLLGSKEKAQNKALRSTGQC